MRCSASSPIKNKVYIITNVDRATHCIVGWDVLWERTEENMQAMLDRSPQAYVYYSDQFSTYDTLIYYPGKHESLPNKGQTYSVEADNARIAPLSGPSGA